MNSAGGADTSDGQGHGTHVSGTAMGTRYGVAKQAIIHPVKVLGDNGAGSYSNVVAGLAWVKQHVAANGWPAVVSMSLGGAFSPVINDAAADVIAVGGWAWGWEAGEGRMVVHPTLPTPHASFCTIPAGGHPCRDQRRERLRRRRLFPEPRLPPRRHHRRQQR